MIVTMEATRVHSPSTARHIPDPIDTYDEDTLAIVNAIPYWPSTITTKEIQATTGLTLSKVYSKVHTSCNRFMIFDDGPNRYSRLMDDLSNVEAM